MRSIVTFTFIQTFDQNFVFVTQWHHVDRQCGAKLLKLVLFSVSGSKDVKLIKMQTCTKTEAYELYSRMF